MRIGFAFIDNQIYNSKLINIVNYQLLIVLTYLSNQLVRVVVVKTINYFD